MRKIIPFLVLLLVANFSAAVGEISRNNVTAGVCFPTPNVQGMRITLEHSLSPIPSAMNYLWEFDPIFKKMGKKKGGEMLAALEKAAKVSVVTQPAIGKLTNTAPDFTDPNDGLVFYNPKLGVMSKDRVVFLVETGDYKIKLIYSIYPLDGASGSESEKKFCGKTGVIYRLP